MNFLEKAAQKTVYGYTDPEQEQQDLMFNSDHFKNPDTFREIADFVLADIMGKRPEERHVDVNGRLTIQQIKSILARAKPDVDYSLTSIRQFAADSREQGLDEIADYTSVLFLENHIKESDPGKWMNADEERPANLDELKGMCRAILSEYERLKKENPEQYKTYPIMQAHGQHVSITEYGSVTSAQRDAARRSAERKHGIKREKDHTLHGVDLDR